MTCQKREDVLLAYLDAHEQEIIDFTGELVATSSANPPGNELEVAEVALSRMGDLGLTGQRCWPGSQSAPTSSIAKRGRVGHRACSSTAIWTPNRWARDRKLWNSDPRCQPSSMASSSGWDRRI